MGDSKMGGMAGSGAVGMANDPSALYEQSRAALQNGNLAKAISIADQILKLTNWAPFACAWAANLRLEARDWRRAIEYAQRGLSKGRSAALFGIQGEAYLALSELGMAELSLREAIKDQPNHAPWWFHLARLLLRMDREFEAMEALTKGVAITPDSGCLIRLAHLELLFGDPVAAFANVIHGLELDPGDVIGNTIAAKSLMELGRVDEANNYWRKAADLAGSNAEEVDLIRVRFLREQGQFVDATSSLQRIVEAHPDSPRAHALMADSRRCSESDLPLIERMESLAAKKLNLSSGERMNLEYSLGKAFDDLGRFEEAMRHFDRANAIGYEALVADGGFDRSNYAAMLKARKEVFSRINIEEAATTGIRDETPIFVMGMMRSGTTLMEQILARHPLVAGAGEQKFWIGLDAKLIDFDERRVRNELLGDAAATYQRLLARYGAGAERVVDKQPGNLLLAGLLHMAFPEARIIYMVRHPLDNAISIWNTNIQTSTSFVHNKGNLAFAIRQYEELMRHWVEVLPADRFMTLSYESLVMDQEVNTRKVLEFCRLPWDDGCLSPEKSQGRVVTPSLWQVRQPVYNTSIGRWKNYEPWLGELRQLA